MKRLILAAAVTAIGLSYATGLQAQTGGQTPPIAGGYTNVTAIPVNDPAIKAISGALFKPTGAGPFPAVVYMIGCAGLDPPPIRAQQKTDIDHMLTKGVAILIVDSFTPRNEPEGVCANHGGRGCRAGAQEATGRARGKSCGPTGNGGGLSGTTG